MNLSDVPDRFAYAAVTLRVVMGAIFIHSGLDKAIDGIGYTYASTYLEKAVPVAAPELKMTVPHLIEFPVWVVAKAGAIIAEPLMRWFATWPFIGTLVTLGELFVGITLLFGAFTRLGSYIGAFFMFLFYYGNAAWKHGLLNSDLVYLVLFLTIAEMGAGQIYGIDARLGEHQLVEQHPWLRYLLG